jgi:CRP-like cAMP-binding protein
VRVITGLLHQRAHTVTMPRSTLAGMPNQETRDESIVAHFSDGLLMHFSVGETIIDGIDDPKGVYLIKAGFVKAFSVSKAGHGNLLLIHEAGEFIPLPWALDGAHTTGLYYEAMTKVTVLRASKDKLRAAMGHNAWLSQEILKQAVNIITVYTQRIQTLEFRSARGRIIAELLNLAERFGELHGKEVFINAPITHQDIADSINMTRETASRALELLFEEGLMGQKDHLFTVLDLPKLQAALN